MVYQWSSISSMDKLYQGLKYANSMSHTQIPPMNLDMKSRIVKNERSSLMGQ